MRVKFVAITILLALIASATAALAVEKETVLYQFSRKSNGYGPQGAEVLDAQGNIYGVASEGGVAGSCCGLIYELSPQVGGGYAYNVIYTFTGVGADGYPTGSLTMDTAGNLYGATADGYNEIYKLSPNGSGGWSENVLYVGSASGFGFSSVAMNAAGEVFATAAFGGANNKGFVLELSPSGGTWRFQDIYDFDGIHGSGGGSGLILDAAGNLYGTTPQGGTSTNCTNGCGVVFRLRPDSTTWIESVLVNFNNTNGWNPAATLSMDASGNLYGTTELGGAKGYGIVFELSPNGSGGWTEHVLHAFSDANGDGSEPNTALVLGEGVIYGTTLTGGLSPSGCSSNINNVISNGCGTVFKLTLSGGLWRESILHSFTGLRDGAFSGGVTVDANGNLFGSADSGGDRDNDGVTFELTAN